VDIKGDSKTVIRAAAGMFYDHPLLAIAFNSDIADAAQQAAGYFDAAGRSRSNCVAQRHAGIPGHRSCLQLCRRHSGVNCTPGAAATAQYQFGRQRFNDRRFPDLTGCCPSPYMSARLQIRLRESGKLYDRAPVNQGHGDLGGYLFVGAHHLPHPLDINAPRTDLQIANYVRCFGTQPTSTNCCADGEPAACSNIVATVIPGLISVTTRAE